MMNLNIYVLIGLTIFFLLAGIVSAFVFGFWWAFPLLLVGIILLVVYILFGSVNSAAKHIQTEEFEEADKKLALTFKPEWLYVTQRAFYYIMKGSIAMHRKDMTEAEALFDKALAMDLPSDNEKGMLLLQLANINASKSKWRAAKNYVREAKKLKITEEAIKGQLHQIEKAVGQSGQIKAARSMGKQGMGMISQGGKSKRRRPKSR